MAAAAISLEARTVPCPPTPHNTMFLFMIVSLLQSFRIMGNVICGPGCTDRICRAELAAQAASGTERSVDAYGAVLYGQRGASKFPDTFPAIDAFPGSDVHTAGRPGDGNAG